MKQDIEMVRGETKVFAITLLNDDDEPYTLQSGETLVFGVKKNPENEEKLILKTVTTGTNGVYNVQLAPADTIDLPFGRYWYDVAVQSAQNFYNIIETGVFQIKQNITKWGDAG